MPLASKAPLLQKEQQIHPLDLPSSPSLTFVEERRETRCAAGDPVEILILEEGGSHLAGTILDDSWGELLLQVDTAISQAAQVEIVIPDRAVIFGKTCYCRRSSDLYHIGVTIRDVYYRHSLSGRHIRAEQLRVFLDGKGLTAPDAVQVRAHLMTCKACRRRLAEVPSSLAALTLSIFEWRPDMVRCWRQVLKYWRTAESFRFDEVDVTDRRVLVDGPTLELLADDGTVVQTFGPGQPYDCWVVELRTNTENDDTPGQ